MNARPPDERLLTRVFGPDDHAPTPVNRGSSDVPWLRPAVTPAPRDDLARVRRRQTALRALERILARTSGR